jgi:hypothetical protein
MEGGSWGREGGGKLREGGGESLRVQWLGGDVGGGRDKVEGGERGDGVK